MRTPPLPLLALLGAVVAVAAAAGALASTDLGGGPTVEETETISLTPSVEEQRPPGPRNETTDSGRPTTGESACGLTCDGPSARSLLSVVSTPSPLALAGLLVVLGLAAVLRFRGRAGDAPVETTRPEEPTTGDLDRSSDRSQTGYDPPPSAPAVRYWRALTDAVAAEAPESTTPREYERLAVAAGYDPEAVATLTGAFEAVRYGEERVDDERVLAAAATLDLREGAS